MSNPTYVLGILTCPELATPLMELPSIWWGRLVDFRLRTKIGRYCFTWQPGQAYKGVQENGSTDALRKDRLACLWNSKEAALWGME